MFESMPEHLKEQVRELLEEDNFISAKEIYDRWKQTSKQNTEKSSMEPTTHPIQIQSSPR